MITYILLGDKITRKPRNGILLQVERSEPTSEALCFARINAAKKVTTEYFTILDGGEDILLDNFEEETENLCKKLTETGLDIGSARDIRPGKESVYMQHTVVCRTSAFKSLILPEKGCFHFETMVYTMLSKRGVVLHDAEIYQWVPSKNGAATWLDTPLARINGYKWALGEKPIDRPAPNNNLKRQNNNI